MEEMKQNSFVSKSKSGSRGSIGYGDNKFLYNTMRTGKGYSD